ncbi:hypothetical protein BO94DRAFT_536752 [Aspergillus sclerotioniger CBS 115572]|uniref:Pentatricopeptide repeat protein n=1 Tax=Aspergillus sclerotioniger CBS 115572 TaxID=1450535 RepID=A0A317WDH8_9EURO|nr:hypothetical protein BO94DRAFT_536752 [Aspergillus sclerotioniger CBS 115572]PWY83282.1 hypothetical protein BO94DRAFT_536752 [Aspergillus sclerotioniger CBS 115572]
MLVCPPKLSRSRVCVGLPSGVPQHRLRLGRRRGAQDIALFRDNAPRSNTSPSEDLYAAQGDLKQLNVRYTNIPENRRQHPSNITSVHGLTIDRSAGNGLLHSQISMRRGVFSLVSPCTGARKLTSSAAFNNDTPSSGVRANYAHPRGLPITLERRIRDTFTFDNPSRVLWFGQEVKNHDLAVRSKAYLYNGLEIRQWKLANRELYQARWDGREVEEEFVDFPLDETDTHLLETLKQGGLEKFCEEWNSLNEVQKEVHWAPLSLWLLRNSPALTLDFLFATCRSFHTRPPFTMVADCLIYLEDLHRAEVEQWRSGPHDFRSVIRFCLDPSRWPVAFVPQKGVRLYIRMADRKHVYVAWTYVSKRKHRLKGETFLAFMNRFMEFGDVNNAFWALKLARYMFARMDIPPMNLMVARHCAKFLTLDSVVDHPDGRNFRILPKLISMGIEPDRDMMNVVLSNALKTGDPQLGLDVLRFMKAESFELDSYSYLSLLHDAVARLDRERIAHLMEELEARPELKKNPYIASKLFHSHFVFNVKNFDATASRREIFYSLLKIYHEVHDITPLQDLSIVPRDYNPPTSGEKTPPSTIALYLMIATWLRCQIQVANVDRLYFKFRELVSQGHKDIAPLAATDHTYNEFMLAYRKNPHGLRAACRVMEDMLRSANEGGGDTGSPEATITQTRPTVRTWTLLLSAFIWNKQPLAGERVKGMMASHGIKYDMGTWNVIIAGLAARQDAQGVAQSIKELEAQGFIADAYTMKSLSYLREPEQLWAAMEQLDLKSAHLRPEGFRRPAPTPLELDETDDEQLAPAFRELDEVEDGIPTPTLVQLDELEDEQLLDRGLQRLKANA